MHREEKTACMKMFEMKFIVSFILLFVNITFSQSQEVTKPKFVLLAFDDQVDQALHAKVTDLLKERKNPNGCKMAATFFVSGKYQQGSYEHVKQLYLEGHEIASHSKNHFKKGWVKKASGAMLMEDMNEERSILSTEADIPSAEIKGLRLPYSDEASEKMKYLQQAANSGYLYDSSFGVGRKSPQLPQKYTFPKDDSETENVAIWVKPTPYLKSMSGNYYPRLGMCFDSNEATKEEVYKLLDLNFQKSNTDQAPFEIHMVGSFLASESQFDGVKTFLDDVEKRGDVYVVTMKEMIQWWQDQTKPMGQCQ